MLVDCSLALICWIAPNYDVWPLDRVLNALKAPAYQLNRSRMRSTPAHPLNRVSNALIPPAHPLNPIPNALIPPAHPLNPVPNPLIPQPPAQPF